MHKNENGNIEHSENQHSQHSCKGLVAEAGSCEWVRCMVSRSVHWSHVFCSCTSCVLSLHDAVGVCSTYLALFESAQIARTCLPWPAERL